MKETKNVDGLTIDIDEDTCSVTYCVFYYDADGGVISSTGYLNADYQGETPDTAETFRVVIKPKQVDGEDVTINRFSIGKYAKQLDITYNK